MGARFLFLFAVLFSAADVSAQAESSEYRQLITEAVQEFDASRFAEARALFRRAHAISPNARTLRGIGLSSFEMSDYVEAYTALTEALASTARPLTDEQRSEVQAVLQRTQRFLAFYRVEVTPSSATLTVDGAPAVTASDGRVILGMGSHEIAARAEGYRDARSTVRIQGGEEEELALELDARGAGGSATDPEDGDPVVAPRRAPFDPVPSILTLSVGVAAVVGAGLAGGLWLPDREVVLDMCLAAPPGDCLNQGEVQAQYYTSIAMTIVLAIGGAAAIVAGLVLLVAPLVEQASTAELACGVEGTSVRCRF